MSNYQIRIEENDITYINIKASNEQEAKEIAESMYNNGQIDMSSGDCEVSFDIINKS